MSKETNFLKETKTILKNHRLNYKDICWVGSSDGEYAITWKDFIKIADIDYDSEYVGQEIVSDIVIVGQNWWLSRHEYDGSECWQFHSIPIKSPNSLAFTLVKDPGGSKWATIEEANTGGKY